jgi:hypothetical protein
VAPLGQFTTTPSPSAPTTKKRKNEKTKAKNEERSEQLEKSGEASGEGGDATAVPLMVIGIWWICLRMLKLSLDSMASAVLGHINRALALTLGSAFAFLLVHS